MDDVIRGRILGLEDAILVLKNLKEEPAAVNEEGIQAAIHILERKLVSTCEKWDRETGARKPDA